ncbi:hypothetical protein M3Y95_01164500 [Aphelenchoides besseyi]|nr:hypothetical protein M3Y95_01164500 [Aphelenchoides besseyi]
MRFNAYGLFIAILLTHPFNCRAQWPSIEVAQTRFAGICAEKGQFDCGILGENKCIPLAQVHNGRPDCPDQSDEYCFPGQIRCGNFCANLEHLSDCLTNPRCESELDYKPSADSQFLEASFCPYLKRKLCVLPNAVPCKGYGECVLRNWLMNGEKNCFDGSDEDPQYSSVFLLSEHVGQHILPHIISTGGSAAVFPFGAPQPEIQTNNPDVVTILTPTSVAIPVPIDIVSTPSASQSHVPDFHQPGEFVPLWPTPHPSSQIETLYPNQPIATTHTSHAQPKHETSWTLYPNQPTTRPETLYPTPKTTTSTTNSPQTSPTPTWWPFGRETFETTKDYVDKLDEFGETYGPATRKWSSTPLIPSNPSINQAPSHSQTPTNFGIGTNPHIEHTISPTKDEWLVFPPLDSTVYATEQPGITVDLPASPGSDTEWLQPWWKQVTGHPLNTHTQPSHFSTFYPGQRVNRPPGIESNTPAPDVSPLRPPHILRPTPPTEDRRPFVVPGGNILVWPNGTLSGPGIQNRPIQENKQFPSIYSTPSNPFGLPQPFTAPSVVSAPTPQPHESSALPSLGSFTTNFPVPVSTIPVPTVAPISVFPANGFWPIAPAQPWPILLPEDADMSETPILIPPTYMPVVSTYAPAAETIAVPTLLPIYPVEIGQNVKATSSHSTVSSSATSMFTSTPYSSDKSTKSEESSITNEYEASTTSLETTTHKNSGHVNATQSSTHNLTTVVHSNLTTESLMTSTYVPISVQTTIGDYEEEDSRKTDGFETMKSTGQTEEAGTTTISSVETSTKETIGNVTESEVAEHTATTNVFSTTNIEAEANLSTSQPSDYSGKPETSTSMFEERTTRLSVDEWAPALILGGVQLANELRKGRKQNATCAATVRKAAHDYVKQVDCSCPVGQMLTSDENCQRAPVATFRVNLHEICDRKFDGAPVEAAELAILKLATSGTIKSACVREREPNGDSSAVVLNVVCANSNCSLDQIRQELEKKQHDLPEVKVEIAADQNGACANSSLNDCGANSICTTEGLYYHCNCADSTADINGDGRDCNSKTVGCTHIFGICLLIWLIILLLLLCLGPLLIGYCCYRCGYLQRTACWSKLRELRGVREKPQDLEAGVPVARPGSATQQPHNEGLPRPPDSTLISISPSRLPDIPHLPSKETDEPGGPDYYNTGNDDEYETESASHGLVSLISTERTETDREPTEAGEDTTAKSVAAEIHRDVTTSDSRRGIDTKRLTTGTIVAGTSTHLSDSQATKQRTTEVRRESTTSRAGTPTIWEKFKILGDQYAQPKDVTPSESSSLDSLLRRYQERELQKLRERNPELFIEPQPISLPTNTQTTQSIPHLVQTPIPPTPIPSTSATFSAFANQPLPGDVDVEYETQFLSDRPIGPNDAVPSTSHASSTSALSAADSSATPMAIEDAIAMAEALNSDYKQRPSNYDEESSTSGEDESLSTIPHTPNSDELFHYPRIEGGEFDYTAEPEDENHSETNESKPDTSKRSTRTADSMRGRDNRIGRESTDELSDPAAVELMEAVAAGRPLPPHMRLPMPVDSPDAARARTTVSTSGMTTNVGARRNPNERPVRGRLQDTPPRSSTSGANRQVKPPIPAAARRTAPNLRPQSKAAIGQKPPRPPIRNVDGTVGLIKPPPAGASVRRPTERPTSPTPGLKKKIVGSRNATVLSQQKLPLDHAAANQVARSVSTGHSKLLPNSERQRKRSSLPMGDIAPKRSPSLPSIGDEKKAKKSSHSRRSLDTATSLEQLKKADFMIADIDLDLPGPHMIPASLDDIRSGRLSEIIAGGSREDDDQLNSIAAKTANEATKSALRSKSTVMSMRRSERTKSISANNDVGPSPLNDPDLSDNIVANQEHLPPLSEGSNSKLRKRDTTIGGGEESISNLHLNELSSLRHQSTKSADGTRSSRPNIEERVHENCLTDRPPWDPTPLKEGDLEKIPLDWNLTRSHSLGHFDSLNSSRRGTKRSRSVADVQSARNGNGNRMDRQFNSDRSKSLNRSRADHKSICPLPVDGSQDSRKQWIEELRKSLNSKNWLNYD